MSDLLPQSRACTKQMGLAEVQWLPQAEKQGKGTGSQPLVLGQRVVVFIVSFGQQEVPSGRKVPALPEEFLLLGGRAGFIRLMESEEKI